MTISTCPDSVYMSRNQFLCGERYIPLCSLLVRGLPTVVLLPEMKKHQNLPQSHLKDAPLPEVAFLIDAVNAYPLPATQSINCDKPPKGYYGRVLWMLDLFAALEQRPVSHSQQARLTSPSAGAYETVAGSVPSGSQSA